MTKLKHGTDSFYKKGCRCNECLVAHRIYERNAKRRRQQIKNGFAPPVVYLVDASEARAHILFLTSRGIGLSSIASLAKTHRSNIQKIKRGQQKMVTPIMHKRIVSIPAIKSNPNHYVSAEPIHEMLAELKIAGVNKSDVARAAGDKYGNIRLKKTVRLHRFKKLEKICLKLMNEHKIAGTYIIKKSGGGQ